MNPTGKVLSIFLSLYTGKRIHSYHWEQSPIPDDVITQVETLARDEDQPMLTDKLPLFEWSQGEPIPFTSPIDPPLSPPSPSDLASAAVPPANVDVAPSDDSVSSASSIVHEAANEEPEIFHDEHHWITDDSDDVLSYASTDDEIYDISSPSPPVAHDDFSA